jgi:hypothetical protein
MEFLCFIFCFLFKIKIVLEQEVFVVIVELHSELKGIFHFIFHDVHTY